VGTVDCIEEVAQENFFMKKQDNYELREEYDLSNMPVMPRGRFDPKRRVGSNVFLLDPEIAKAFANDESVNEALRLILEATRFPKRETISRQ
jgi:hypothetical protein